MNKRSLVGAPLSGDLAPGLLGYGSRCYPQVEVRKVRSDVWSLGRERYLRLSTAERTRLFDIAARSLTGTRREVRELHILNFTRLHIAFGAGVREAVDAREDLEDCHSGYTDEL